MDVHPAAEIFPLIDITELAEDIKKQGLLKPIELYDGKVLDGRNRLRACEVAGVDPEFIDVHPEDPVAYVLSLNSKRRHLTQSQRSLAGAKARGMYDEAAKERMRMSKGQGVKGVASSPPLNSGKARDAVGVAVGVSGRSIDRATKVVKKGIPELVEKVESGGITVTEAARVADLPKEQQKTHLEAPPEYVAEKEPDENYEKGRGLRRAHEAIDCLRRIPDNDPQKGDGFKLVMNFIKTNK